MANFGGLITWGEIETLARLLIAATLGGLVGWEREKSGKVAGLRTHSLVALGAALFTSISLLLFADFPSLGGIQGFDYHIVANIIVGIGFIGAGSILKREDKIEGTTTAASLWVVAAIGMAAGLGYYKAAIATALLAYGILAGLWYLEMRWRTKIRYDNGHKPLEYIEE